MQLETFGLSIAGRRANNEDAICARPELGLFVVADGMGGYEGGEVASALAVEAIHELVRRTAGDADVTWPYKIDPTRSIIENEVLVATRLANERITLRRTGELCEMGSTVVVLRLEDDHAVIGHVGDSRLYRLRAGVVTRALGTATGEPEIARVAVTTGDVYLLCSDGLSEVLEPVAIAQLLDQTPELACRALIAAAYEAGSRDNISAVVVRVS